MFIFFFFSFLFLSSVKMPKEFEKFLREVQKRARVTEEEMAKAAKKAAEGGKQEGNQEGKQNQEGEGKQNTPPPGFSGLKLHFARFSLSLLLVST